MALTQCPECHGTVSTSAHACPHCGFVPPPAPVQHAYPAPPTPPPKKRNEGWKLLGVLFAFGFVAAVAATSLAAGAAILVAGVGLAGATLAGRFASNVPPWIEKLAAHATRAAAVSVLFIVGGLLGISTKVANEERDRENAEAAAQARAAESARAEEARRKAEATFAEVAERAPTWTKHLDDAKRHIDGGDPVKTRAALTPVTQGLAPVRELPSPPADIRALLERHDALTKALRDFELPLFEAYFSARYDGAAELSREEALAIAAKKKSVPPSTLEAVVDAYEDEEVRRRKARRAAEAKALEERCGRKPTVSAWDGGIIAVESYFEASAHDPDSIEVKNCTQPVMTEGCWLTQCQVRGKNAFGALILQNQRCLIGKNPASSVLGLVLACEVVK